SQSIDGDAVHEAGVIDAHREGDGATRFIKCIRVGRLDDLNRGQDIGYSDGGIVVSSDGIVVIVGARGGDDISLSVSRIARDGGSEDALVETTSGNGLGHST